MAGLVSENNLDVGLWLLDINRFSFFLIIGAILTLVPLVGKYTIRKQWGKRLERNGLRVSAQLQRIILGISVDFLFLDKSAAAS